jgi:hypothetical protein
MLQQVPARVLEAGAGLPSDPSITSGEKLPLGRGAPRPGAIESGKRTTSMARALLGSRRMKPRSSRAVISRWMPDLERRSKASFISSKDGGTPVSFSLS